MSSRVNSRCAAFSGVHKEKPIAGNQRGLTYVEILIATFILLIGLLPALDALRSAVLGTRAGDSFVAAQHRLSGHLEELLGEPFSALDDAAQSAGAPGTPTTYSDPGGTPDRVLVFLARYDGDDADADGDYFTGGDDGLLWVRVEIDQTPYSLETLVAK